MANEGAGGLEGDGWLMKELGGLEGDKRLSW